MTWIEELKFLCAEERGVFFLAASCSFRCDAVESMSIRDFDGYGLREVSV